MHQKSVSFIDAESSPLHRRDTVLVESTPFAIRSPAHSETRIAVADADADGDYELQSMPLVAASWDAKPIVASGRLFASTTEVSSYCKFKSPALEFL